MKKYCLDCKKRDKCVTPCKKVKDLLEYSGTDHIEDRELIDYAFLVLQRSGLNGQQIIRIRDIIKNKADSSIYGWMKRSLKHGKKMIDYFTYYRKFTIAQIRLNENHEYKL